LTRFAARHGAPGGIDARPMPNGREQRL
jgi:hypothetical protein